ncbi:hypothetical protein [Leptospira alstonii]|uniref:Uncharacterized protein n=2 Tax=Leptospira alstonii TaxID=28452 RepID=M6CWP8_9LEPT|nr:hypothetical protein [Leptospira alstonii]EMJ96327.1 hypothetical protein LEP1GSC194_3288 [Leptospira alstonii serovar Sichuan str. 79601]EQA81659.1 hypothetical protein LEP1GSC193_2876 [Leptospira alstonii serovar Pingchang str. 80-412]
MSSIHDNFIQSYEVNLNAGEIIIHTIYLDQEPNEFTDIIFRGVVSHFFQDVGVNNIVFDIEESNSDFILEQFKNQLENRKKWNWPFLYDSEKEFIHYIESKHLKFFQIDSVCGLNGWVLALEMEIKSRS